MILLRAITIHVLFKNHFVFLLLNALKFRNRGRQQKGGFFLPFPPIIDAR